ncbi:Zn-dependent hydrolase [Halobacillus shinanisalinarum]|uniref:Zn-dependent hydrolase n=1 Tax=Halobacillus shinanisalinarum TaxID=2932258 RepID=A0ABY4H3X7_9BACI|nr:Zn-dependent hydrolase [Halobacillus shinanisalinarum]UOQ95157.1 Zn-dependent hydrolase [Halobacillus shinanisalinarum]
MINIDRLRARMTEMAKIGATPNGGVTRLALSEEDKRARKLFVKWMEEVGLDTRVDDFGNIYGKLHGLERGLPVVMAGSHLDTVPKGGNFDGVLGVLGALEAVESLIEQGVKPLRSIELVSFTNEEGARFTPQMLGSGAVTGQFTKDYVYTREDNKGFLFKDELEAIDFKGEESNRPREVSAFIELHIEQGPMLEIEQKSVGIVEGIAGFSWMQVEVAGQSDHSGSTPMSMRNDSLVKAAAIIQKISLWAENRDEQTVATVGNITTSPGIINAVPGETKFTIDFRHPNREELYKGMEEIKQLIKTEVEESSLSSTVKEIRTHQPVHFSNEICTLMEGTCRSLSHPYKHLISGAGHDAMYMQHITNAGMLFVPSINGKSHCEEENTEWEDIECGIVTLFHVLNKLANQPLGVASNNLNNNIKQ